MWNSCEVISVDCYSTLMQFGVIAANVNCSSYSFVFTFLHPLSAGFSGETLKGCSFRLCQGKKTNPIWGALLTCVGRH